MDLAAFALASSDPRKIVPHFMRNQFSSADPTGLWLYTYLLGRLRLMDEVVFALKTCNISA